MKKVKTVFVMWILFLFFGIPGLPVCAGESDPIYYVAFGDSIPNGYSGDEDADLTAYPELIERDLEEEGGKQTGLVKYTKNGITAKGLYDQYLSDETVQKDIADADLITVTVGANDLLKEFRSVTAQILESDVKFRTTNEAIQTLQDGLEENPLLFVKAAAAIRNWDYESFDRDWTEMIQVISDNKKGDAQIVVTTIYNPVNNLEFPDAFDDAIIGVIEKMNNVMEEHAEEYGYQVADLLEIGVEEQTQTDGIHPNQEGHKLIRSMVESQMDIEKLTGKDPGENSTLRRQKEQAQQAMRQKEKAQKEKTRRTMILRVGAGLLAVLFVLFAASIVVYRKKAGKRKKLLLSAPCHKEGKRL